MAIFEFGVPSNTGTWSNPTTGNWQSPGMSFSGGVTRRRPAARWTNILIPQGSIINLATLAYFSPGGSGSALVGFHQVDNAPAPEAGQQTTDNLPVVSSPFGIGDKTVNVTAGLQAVVNRPGWLSGNAMIIQWSGGAETTSGSTIENPTITVDYTPPGGPVGVYLGGSWQKAPVKMHNGTEWKTARPKVYIGGQWVDTE